MRIRYLIISILVFLYNAAFGQPELEKKLKSASPKEKVEILIKLISKNNKTEPKKTINFAENLIEIAEKNKIKINDKYYYQIIGDAHIKLGNFRRARKAFDNGVELSNEASASYALFKVGLKFLHANKKDYAVEYFNKSLKAARLQNNTQLIKKNLGYLYSIAIEKKDFSSAHNYLKEFTKQQLEEADKSKDLANFLLSEKQKEAFEKDSIIEQNRHTQTNLIERNDTITRQKDTLDNKLFLKTLEANNQRFIKQIFFWITFLILIFMSILVNMFIQKRKLNFVLQTKNDEIEHKNKQIISSINYARRLQDAILPPIKDLQQFFPQSFIMYQPKDIVSGDFYWFANVDDKIIFAMVDCTGHGVPGALMSMMGDTLLNKIVILKKITKPDLILENLHNEIMLALKQESETAKTNDGMDMSICVFDKPNKKYYIAGAKSQVIKIENGQMQIISTDLHSIGEKPLRKNAASNFKTQEFEIVSDTQLYFFTDGYCDQVGGPGGKKFNSRPFEELLTQVATLDAVTQYTKINNAFVEWKASHNQVDDVTIVGIKL